MLTLIIVLIVVMLLCGGYTSGVYGGAGFNGLQSGGVGLVIVILVLFLLFGGIH